MATVVGYAVSAFSPEESFRTDIGGRLCGFSLVKGHVIMMGVVISAANDTIIFLAITYRLLSDRFRLSVASRLSAVSAFFKGEGLGALSRLLLQTGQFYYL